MSTTGRMSAEVLVLAALGAREGGLVAKALRRLERRGVIVRRSGGGWRLRWHRV